MNYTKKRGAVNGKLPCVKNRTIFVCGIGFVAGSLIYGDHKTAFLFAVAFVWLFILAVIENRAFDRELEEMAKEVKERGNDQ